MAVVATFVGTTLTGADLLSTTDQALETVNPFMREIPFNLIIKNQFVSGSVNPVVFTDDSDVTEIPLLDRNNKPITAVQLYGYAGERIPIRCIYNSLFNVIRVCSCVPPTLLFCPCPEQATKPAPVLA